MNSTFGRSTELSVMFSRRSEPYHALFAKRKHDAGYTKSNKDSSS